VRERTYLVRCGELPLVVFVDEAFVQQRNQCIRVDMRGKVKLSVRLVDPPLLLQLGGRLSIICGGQSVSPHQKLQRAPSMAAAGHRKESRRGGVHILDSSRYLDSERNRHS
jgi:hypothetical protein